MHCLALTVYSGMVCFVPTEPDVPEAESPKKKEEMTLLGVLGLVKKKADSPSPCKLVMLCLRKKHNYCKHNMVNIPIQLPLVK